MTSRGSKLIGLSLMAGFWILSKLEMQHATAKAASALVWAKFEISSEAF